MGIPFRIAFYATDDARSQALATAVFERLRELDQRLSDWNPESELMRLCDRAGDGRWHAVSADLFAVLTRARDFWQRSGGAFDPTVGALVRLWREARRTRRLPDESARRAATALVGMEAVELDADVRRVRISKPGLRLDLGGIAKGYALDQALRVLGSEGVTRAMIDGGGDVAVADPPPGASGWRIGVGALEPDAPPSRMLLLRGLAVATSGDAWQFVEIDGVRYSHILDPATGLGLTHRSSVTVVAPDGTTADALATALSVMPLDRGLALIEATPGCAALFVRESGGWVSVHASERFVNLPQEPPR